MFERNRSESADLGTLSIVLTLADGREMSGKLALPAGRSLAEALNGQALFLDFEPFDGERTFVAKSAIAAVKQIKVPRAPNLSLRLRELDGFDPHAVLGVTRESDWDEVRRAYHTLAKTYHPDRYATAELPDEAATYLATMSRRINQAYAILETAEASRKQRATQKQQPIYTSAARG